MMRQKNFDALVLGMNPTGLGIIQGLGERGVRLACVDSHRMEIGNFSRYGTKFICPMDDLLSWLRDFGDASQTKTLVYPTSDEYLLFLSKYHTELEPYFHFPFPTNGLVEKLLDKFQFYQLVSQYTELIPKTLMLDDDIEGWDRWPAIIKPVHIHEFKRHFPGQKVIVVDNEKELAAKKEMLSRLHIPAMLQEIVKGPDDEQYSVCAYIDKEGTAVESMATRKNRQVPSGFGVGTYVEMIEAPSLVKRALKLLNEIEFQGIAEVEYRRDQDDGELKLIEINSRAWAQNKLASYGGCDIIGAAYSHNTDHQLAPLGDNASKWFYLFRDLQTHIPSMMERKIGLNEILSSYSDFKGNVGAIWNRKDLSASLFLPVYATWKLLSGPRNK